MNRFYRVLVGAAGVLLAAACSPGLKPAAMVLTKPPFTESKIEIHAPALGQSLENGFITGEDNYPNVVLPRGSRLAVLFDTGCLHTHISPLGQQIIFSPPPSSLRTLGAEWVLLREQTAQELKQLVDVDPCVLGVSENARLEPAGFVGLDPKYRFQLQLHETQWEESLSFFEASQDSLEEVVVAVIDSGVDFSHEDLKERAWRDQDGHAGYDFFEGRPDHSDPHGHGTFVAGLIAAQNSNGLGVASAAGNNGRIMSVRAFGGSTEQPHATTVSILNSLYYAADNGAEVMNLSFGGWGLSRSQQAALEYALQKGSLIVAASGNNGSYIGVERPYSPAMFSQILRGMITVGALNLKTGLMADFSNHSTSVVTLAAPGAGGVYSTVPGNRYDTNHGTSMAAPMVAGAAALVMGYLKAHDAPYTPALVEKLLLEGSDRLGPISTEVKDGRSLNYLTLAKAVAKHLGQTGPDASAPVWADGEITEVVSTPEGALVRGFLCGRSLDFPGTLWLQQGSKRLPLTVVHVQSDFVWSGECRDENFMRHRFSAVLKSAADLEGASFYIQQPAGQWERVAQLLSR